MNLRRTFIKHTSLAALAAQWTYSLSSIAMSSCMANGYVDWEEVRKQFPIVQWEKLQFNSGSAGVMPAIVSDYLISLTKTINAMAPYEAWSSWQESMEETKRRLAKLINVDREELQFVRNTTEALNMIIYGLNLAPNDEVILCEHDYPYAINAWKNRASRDRIKLKLIEFELPNSDEAIINIYSKAITPLTKILHVTYMTHRQGHIMPVDKLVKLAQKHNIQVVIDGAHTLGQIAVDISKLGCDYYATSLHKWLNAPHGTGLLFVKNERITELMPHPSSNLNDETIVKYAHLGTRAYQQEVGIAAALDFHELLGSHRKYSRLQELKHYWTGYLKQNERIKWHTDLSDDKSCSVATISINGMSSSKATKILDQKYDIHAKSVGGSWGSGIRISPNIFTNFQELDQLVFAINEICKV